MTSNGTNVKTLDRLFGTDQSSEADGAWMTIDAEGGMRVKVRAQSAPKVRSVALACQKKLRPFYAIGQTPPVADLDANEVQLCADGLVVAWEGFSTPEGAPIACTPDSVRDVVTAYPHFRRAILSFSGEIENFRQAEREAIAKN